MNTRICLWLLLFSFGAEAFAQNAHLNNSIQPALQTAVPLELRRSHAYLSIKINHQGPFQFAIDTGFAGEALVSEAVAERLKLPPSGSRTIGDPSGIGNREVKSYRLAAIQLGDSIFENIDAGVDLALPGPDGPRDGVLGFALFKHGLLTLDYPNQQFLLAKGELTQESSGQVVPYTFSNGIPTIILHLGESAFPAHIDSGGMGLSLPEAMAAKLSFQAEPVVIGRMMSASNNIEIKGARLAGDIKFASYIFCSPFVEINPLFPEATLGSIPLSRFRVSFDLDRHLVRFESSESVIDIAPPVRRPMPAAPPA